jgi:hypothetical protein
MPIPFLHDPVYKAITTICELKGSASYAEIASVSGIKKQKALDIIIRNKHLLRLDKVGKVKGFISHEQNVIRIVDGLFTMGKVYKTALINYGADSEVLVHKMHYEAVKDLSVKYICGGIGDCYTIDCILLTEGIKKALEKRGFKYFDEVVKEKIDKGENQVWTDWCNP